MKWVTGWAYNLWKDEEGQGMVEYGLILALIAAVVMATLLILGGKIDGIFQKINQKLPEPPAAGG